MSDAARRASHEAGHALVATLEGARLLDVDMVPNGAHRGRVRVAAGESDLALLKVAVAGPIVDTLMGHEDGVGLDSDAESITQYALAACDGDGEKAARLVRAVFANVERVLARHARAHSLIAASFAANQRMSGPWAQEIVETSLAIEESESEGMHRMKFSAGHAPAERWTEWES